MSDKWEDKIRKLEKEGKVFDKGSALHVIKKQSEKIENLQRYIDHLEMYVKHHEKRISRLERELNPSENGKIRKSG